MPRRGEGRTITADGRTLSIIQWATWLGWDEKVIRTRLRLGWDPERAVTEPPRDVDRTGERDYAEVRRERRRLRAEAGLCIHCGLPAEPSKTQCARHLRAAAKSMRELQQTRRELGMCVDCDEPAQAGFATCERHGSERTQAQIEARERKRAAGECTRCKRKAFKGHALCRVHIAADRKEYEAREKDARRAVHDDRRIEGVCITCGAERVVKGKLLCAKHQAEVRALAAKTKAKREKAKLVVRPGVIRRRKPG